MVDRDRPNSQLEFRRAPKDVVTGAWYKMRYDPREAKQEANYENGYKSQSIRVPGPKAENKEITDVGSPLNVPGT